MAMEGSWRLIYSSAFSPGSGSGGGASANSPPIFQTPDRGGFPGGLGPLSPVIIGAVYQDVSFARETLNNVVEFTLRVPGISFLLPQSVSVVRASLIHKRERPSRTHQRTSSHNPPCTLSMAPGPMRAPSSLEAALRRGD